MSQKKDRARAKRAVEAATMRKFRSNPAGGMAALQKAGFRLGDDGYAYRDTTKLAKVLDDKAGLTHKLVTRSTRYRFATALRVVASVSRA